MTVLRTYTPLHRQPEKKKKKGEGGGGGGGRKQTPRFTFLSPSKKRKKFLKKVKKGEGERKEAY